RPGGMLTPAAQPALIRGRTCMNRSGSEAGRPFSGSRACRCRMAAPASAASMAEAAICSGVTGSASDIDGVWMLPVTAHVMMTLPFWLDMISPPPIARRKLDQTRDGINPVSMPDAVREQIHHQHAADDHRQPDHA